jgi:hypothetical protein
VIPFLLRKKGKKVYKQLHSAKPWSTAGIIDSAHFATPPGFALWGKSC